MIESIQKDLYGYVGQPLPDSPGVLVLDGFGTPVPGVTVVWTELPGSGVISPSSTITDANGNAFTTWTLPTTPGEVVIAAHIPAYPAVASAPFDVVAWAGPATSLVFVGQPSSGVADSTLAPSVRVAVKDPYGNLVRNNKVTVTLQGGTPGATLTGTTTQPASSPTDEAAVFWNLSIDTPGSGYTLVASSPGLPSVTSAAFNVAPHPTPWWQDGVGILNSCVLTIAAIGSDGRFYVTDQNGGKSFWSYDPVTGNQMLLAPIPTWNYNFALAGGPDGRIYAVGGTDPTTPYVATSRVDAFDISTNTWTRVADMTTSHSYPCAATGGDGRLYAFSGIETTVIEAYTPATDTWTAVGNVGLGGAYLTNSVAATGPDGNIYIAGGTTSFLGGTGPSSAYATNLFLVYTPGTSSTTALPSLPDTRIFAGGTFGSDGRFYLIAGEDSTTAFLDASADQATALIYDIATGSWSTLAAPLHRPRCALAALTAPDGRLFALGGTDPTQTTMNSVEFYGPQIALTPASASPGTTVNVSGSSFAGTSTVAVHWGSATGTTIVTGTTDSTGAIQQPLGITVPAGTSSGTYSIVVVDPVNNYPAIARLTVP